MSDYSGNFSDPGNQMPGFPQFQGFGQGPDLSSMIQQFITKKKQQGLTQQQTMSSLAKAIQMLKMKQMSGTPVQDWGSDPALASIFAGQDTGY